MPNPILDAARARLLAITAERAALDREERELRAMVAAGEGASSVPAPAVLPSIPVIVPHYGPPGPPGYPWTLGGPLTVGDGWTGAGTTICVGDVNPSAGNVMAAGSLAFDDAEMLSQGWRRCGISDTTGGPYYVKGPDLSHVTLS